MNNKDMKDVELLIRQVMDCAKNIRRQLGPGYVESVYKNAMVLELRKLGLHHETEKPIVVYYDECVVGEFKADIVVDGILFWN